MLAAAVRPWVEVRRTRFECADSGESCGHATEVLLRRGMTGNVYIGPDACHVRVGSMLRSAVKIDIGKARDGDKWRRPYTESSVSVGGLSVKIQSSDGLVRLATSDISSESHDLSVSLLMREGHAFAWGTPAFDWRIGDVGVRYVSRAANKRGHEEYKAKRAAEKAANDSKAAAA